MLCPACDIDMLVLEFELVEIDYCHRCGGVWLDSGELALLGERAGTVRNDLLLAIEQEEGERVGDRRCPVCRKAMYEIATPAPNRIVLDRCPRRHGLWFDRGELKSVVLAAGCDEGNVLLRFLGNLEAQRTKSEAS